jgi:hypothetical protein
MAERRIVRTGNQEDEEPAEERRAQTSDDEERGTRRRSRPSSGADSGVTTAEAAQAALRQIAELTGKQTEGVAGIERAEDGWVVGVEVVEDRRIPSSTDVLATYETELDMNGELISYRRVRRYMRGRGDSEDS